MNPIEFIMKLPDSGGLVEARVTFKGKDPESYILITIPELHVVEFKSFSEKDREAIRARAYELFQSPNPQEP